MSDSLLSPNAIKCPSDGPKEERDPTKCDICCSREGVRLVEQRIKWGKSARIGRNNGYTGRPVPWCAACRDRRGRWSFRYHRPKE